MESLGNVYLSPSTNIVILRRNGAKIFLSFPESNLARFHTSFLTAKKPVNSGLLHSMTLKEQRSASISPISASTSPSQESVQVDLEQSDSQTQPQGTDDTNTRTVRVRFLLQRECSFGEQFLLVGDDSILGLWDPECGLPLEWSAGHVWAVELDIPVGRAIRYKFILKGIDGKMMWQPDPDRVLQTWEASKTIVVLEDWEDPHSQKTVEEEVQTTHGIVEEDPAVDEDLKPVSDSDLQIVTESSHPQRSETVLDIKEVQITQSIVKEESVTIEDSDLVDTDSSLRNVVESLAPQQSGTIVNDVKEEQLTQSVAKDLVTNEDPETAATNSSLHIVETDLAALETEPGSVSVDPPLPGDHETATVTDNAATSLENPIAVLADDISTCQHQEESSTSHQLLSENTTDSLKEELVLSPSNDVEDVNDIESSPEVMNSRIIDIDKSYVSHEGAPVLVPDLSPFSESIDEEPAPSEDERSIAFDATVGGLNDHKSPISEEEGIVIEYIREELEEDKTVEPHKDDDRTVEEGIGLEMHGSASGCCDEGSTPRGGKDCILENNVEWVQKLLTNLGLL